jgi:hypothetical protein
MDSLDRITELFLSHTGDSVREQGGRVRKKQLINRLNFLNFQDLPILINLKHKKYDTVISVKAMPQPCAGDRLECVWAEPAVLGNKLDSYDVHNFFLFDGRKIVMVESIVLSVNEKGISFLLPENSYETGIRKLKRHPCEGVHVGLVQNGARFQGVLRDFTPVSFCVEVTAELPVTTRWIDPQASVYLSFSDGPQAIFSGECRIIRENRDREVINYVLEPLQQQIRRFRPREYRSTRQMLNPSPHIVFTHPLIKSQVSLKVIDLSGSGFSVEEDEGTSLLLPGMILQELDLCFADGFRISCTAQIVYRNICGGDNDCNSVKCGLAVLDMEISDQVRLMGLLHQAADRNSYLCSTVDMDALWNFFFETGFIYPEKYAFFQGDKEEMKRTYERLYSSNPEIARHFIYQDKGAILGHMAMVRLYDNSWLIHHHAACKSGSDKAGLIVLNRISRFVNDIQHLRSAHLDYVFCYFRPENKFPNRVFGEFARQLNEPYGCSLDTFAYFHYRPAADKEMLPSGIWGLAAASPDDLEELAGFYGHASGGLMLDAFALRAGSDADDELTGKYRELGFRKKRQTLALTEKGKLKAVIVAGLTDIGLNMSNLTSCVTVMVLDDQLPRGILDRAISSVAGEYGQNGMPVLIYPFSYAERESFPCEKTYTLWVLNLQYLDHYFKFCDTIFNSRHTTS